MIAKFTSLLLVILLAVSTACETSERAPAPPPNSEKTLVIGLIPEQNLFRQFERYEPLAAYLSEKTGMAVKMRVLTRYGNIIDNFTSGGLDGAFFGSFTYALAHEKLGVEVLARPESADGVSTYQGLMFVRKDSGIKSAKDMKGKRFAFVDKATTAGYLLPAFYFRKYDIDYRTFLREFYFTGTHEDAIYDVLNRKADIGAAKNTVFDRLAASDPRIRANLVVLARSPQVPENGLAVRKDLDPGLKVKIKDILLRMDRDPEGSKVLAKFGARRFIETSDTDYRPVFQYAREIGLRLATYNYRNN